MNVPNKKALGSLKCFKLTISPLLITIGILFQWILGKQEIFRDIIIFLIIFFLSGFSFTDTDNSHDSREREGTIFYFTQPLSPAQGHPGIYL